MRTDMKKLFILLLTFAVALAAVAQTTTLATDVKLSPAERSMAQANQLIAKNPKNFEAYNALALALSRRAHETSDVKFYTQAEETLRQSFEISPGNFDGGRILVWLLLGKHEFAAAREQARKLKKKMPDDVMNMALQSTPPSEVEDAAWIVTQMAHLDLTVGKTAEAEKQLQHALALFPDYHYALGSLSKVRIQQKRYDEAILLLEQRYQAAPHAENLYDLAEALQTAGRTDEAKRVFAQFEQASLLETNRADNSNRELIFYYADYAHEPVQSLEVAKREFARRPDAFTLDGYAWALYVNGRYQEARAQIEKALVVGLRDARLMRHAGEIALKAGDRASAERYLRQATDLNTVESEPARAALARLSSSPAQR